MKRASKVPRLAPHGKKTKPRETSLYVDLGTAKPVNGFVLSARTGKVALTYKGHPLLPWKAETRIGYERPKGFKTAVRARVDPKRLVASANLALEQYDSVFAVDTNTKLVGGNTISITSVIHGKPSSLKIPGKTAIMILERQAIEFRNTSFNPEKVGWYQVITGLQQSPGYSDQIKIGVIVDSDLDNLEAFNKQEQPILKEYYLPRNFILMYASSDTQGDSLLNMLISMADKDAREVLQMVIETSAYERSLEVPSEFFSYLRLWQREKA